MEHKSKNRFKVNTHPMLYFHIDQGVDSIVFGVVSCLINREGQSQSVRVSMGNRIVWILLRILMEVFLSCEHG